MLLVSLLHFAGFSILTDSGGPADVAIYDVPIVPAPAVIPAFADVLTVMTVLFLLEMCCW